MTTAKTETAPFEPATYLTSPESQIELLSDALETGDSSYIATALGTIARARGMTGVAKEAGVTREALYRALSAKGDPRLSTVMGVMRALGMELTSFDRQDELGDIAETIRRAIPSLNVIESVGHDDDTFTVKLSRKRSITKLLKQT